MTKPFVAPFHETETLLLQPAPNGGWTVMAKAPDGNARVIGAFGSYEAMIAGLTIPYTAPKCDICRDHGFTDWAHLSVDPCPVCRPAWDEARQVKQGREEVAQKIMQAAGSQI